MSSQLLPTPNAFATGRKKARLWCCVTWMANGPTRLWGSVVAWSKPIWRGNSNEPEKVVLHQNTWSAVRRCWTHFLTLAATGALAYLNIAGYFVGSSLPGDTSDNHQGFYLLCLQITAKVYVTFTLHCSSTTGGLIDFRNCLSSPLLQ